MPALDMRGLVMQGAGIGGNPSPEGQNAINVIDTITPESLSKMMKRLGLGMDGTNNMKAGNQSPGSGQGNVQWGDKPLAEQTRFAGFNEKGNDSMLNTIMSSGLNKFIGKAIWG